MSGAARPHLFRANDIGMILASTPIGNNHALLFFETHGNLYSEKELILLACILFRTCHSLVMSQTQTKGNAMDQDTARLLNVVRAIADTIRDLQEVPSGNLYAQLCGSMNLNQYNTILGILKRSKLVEESNHMLRWVGPPKP